MKIIFADDFNSPKLELQIGDQKFEFSNGGTPFEVAEEVGHYCIRLGFFVQCQPEAEPEIEAVPTAALPKQVAPRKG